MGLTSQVSIRSYPEPLRSLAYTGISGAYALIGSGLVWPSRILKFTNTTNVSVTISWDGTNDHDIIPPNSFCLYDFSTNKIVEQGWFATGGQRFYVKGTSTNPSSGSVYVTTFFGLSEGG